MKSEVQIMGQHKSGRTMIHLLGIFMLLFFHFVPFFALSNGAQPEKLSEAELSEKTVISVSELLVLMQEESEVFLIDLRIVADENDDALLSAESFDPLYVLSPDPEGSSTVRKINFFSCVFEVPLHFSSWSFSKLNLLGCQANASLTFRYLNKTGTHPIHIENCLFLDAFEFQSQIIPLGKLEIQNCQFQKNLNVESGLEELQIMRCCFHANNKLYESEDTEKTHFQFSIKAQTIGSLVMDHCIFFNDGVPNLFSVDFSESSLQSLSMKHNNLHSFDLSSASVEKSLLIDSLTVETYIGILNFDFPDKNTNIPWYNLGGEKLAIFKKGTSELLFPFQAKTSKQLSNTLDYNDLISAYTKFNALYHDRGDLSSANASYVEIKTIETRRQGYMQEVNPSRNNWINYMLNVFLRDFSDYATNPGKSIVFSLWVLITFTVLYMFSFSGWDKMNYAYYLEQITLFSRYIKNKESVADVYQRKENPHEKAMSDLQWNYIKAGKKVPFLLKLFGRVIHFFGKMRFKIMPKLIRLFNFQPKEWKELETGEKIVSGFLIAVISLTFLLFVLLVKFFNSLILSLNSFVVIGFGALPEGEDGLAMYLSIIEGIIGWFLLTIFTITLLSQVLQSAG